MAPFTQIAFIPKQDGYFLYIKQDAPRLSIDDQSDAYRSTVVQFVENKVDDIKLIFNLPYTGDTLRDSLKIKEMEILFKESDGVAIKIIDTITIDEIENQAGTTSVFTYDYLSKKPFISFSLPTHNNSKGKDATVFSRNSKSGLCHEKVSIPRYFPSGFIDGEAAFNARTAFLALDSLFVL